MGHLLRLPHSTQSLSRRSNIYNIPYIADWNKIGDYRQCQTDLNTTRENNSCIDFDYKVGGKELVRKMVSSAKQKAGMTVNHGQSRQFIQIGVLAPLTTEFSRF
jgi:hypothetical protein